MTSNQQGALDAGPADVPYLPAGNAWVRTYEHGADYIESIDGVLWADAPLPGWLHRCRPQTRGHMSLTYIARCRCGATWISGGWIRKNETRKMRKRLGSIAPKQPITDASGGA